MANNDKQHSARGQIEFRLRERERFLRTLISNLPGVVFRCLADSQLTKEFVSDGCLNLIGYKAEELTGKHAVIAWSDLIHPEDRERVLLEVQQFIKSEQVFAGEQLQTSYRMVARDNSIKHVRDCFRFVHDSLGKIVALEGFVTDITEQTLADKQMRESDDRYRLLAENIRDLICLHELDGKYLYVSPSSKTLLGFAPEDLIGKSPYDFIHPEDVERLRDDVHARLQRGETGIVVEYRMKKKSGEYIWLETVAQTVTDAGGIVVQLQTASRDVSKRKLAEQEIQATQEELARLLFSEQEARREADNARVELEHAMRVKDEFLQMISHEFRTPLTTIKTLVRVLQHDGETREERREYLETIASECDRQIDMILNLLDVSRIEENSLDLKNEAIDVSRLLSSCESIERHAAEARRQILVVTQDENLPLMRGDEKAVRRALCTIIENAIKYTPEEGMITISARHIALRVSHNKAESDKKIAADLFGDLPSQIIVQTNELPVGEEIAFVICDTGRGILPVDVPKIFQKFYRGRKPLADTSTDGTPDDAAGKAETPGVGLGLYLAKRLINALGGRISVNSEVGRGSCFTVLLPVWNQMQHETDTVDEYGFDEGLQVL